MPPHSSQGSRFSSPLLHSTLLRSSQRPISSLLLSSPLPPPCLKASPPSFPLLHSSTHSPRPLLENPFSSSLLTSPPPQVSRDLSHGSTSYFHYSFMAVRLIFITSSWQYVLFPVQLHGSTSYLQYSFIAVQLISITASWHCCSHAICTTSCLAFSNAFPQLYSICAARLALLFVHALVHMLVLLLDRMLRLACPLDSAFAAPHAWILLRTRTSVSHFETSQEKRPLTSN